MSKRRLWSRDELLLAFNLYNQIPFGSIHSGNPLIQELAAIIDRTPNSVSLKLSNLARFDPFLQARGIKGMSHGAKADEDIWREFEADPEGLAYESERVMLQYAGNKHVLAEVSDIDDDSYADIQGAERLALTKQRTNQNFFRKRILASYNFTCCVTGINVRELLVASHIIPWAEDKANRLNPRNGLCLNPMHDKAFDRGLMWVDADFRVRFNERKLTQNPANDWFLHYEGRQLMLPKGFQPDISLLNRHASKAMAA